MGIFNKSDKKIDLREAEKRIIAQYGYLISGEPKCRFSNDSLWVCFDGDMVHNIGGFYQFEIELFIDGHMNVEITFGESVNIYDYEDVELFYELLAAVYAFHAFEGGKESVYHGCLDFLEVENMGYLALRSSVLIDKKNYIDYIDRLIEDWKDVWEHSGFQNLFATVQEMRSNKPET